MIEYRQLDKHTFKGEIEMEEKQLYLYHVTQEENIGYDTFSDIVVAAYSKKDAAKIHPYRDIYGILDEHNNNAWDYCSTWASSPKHVNVTKIGKASKNITQPDVICASFHAG